MPRDRTKTFAVELRDGLLQAYTQVRTAKGDKYAYAVALDRLALFLRQLEHTDCAGWIKELSSQLAALEIIGHRGPVLQSTKNPGKTLSPLERRHRLYVAAGVKALIRSGIGREDAAKQARRKVDAIKDEPVKRILSWMDELGKKNAWVDELGKKRGNPVFQGMLKLKPPAKENGRVLSAAEIKALWKIDSEDWFQLANALRK
jgi:hypothetical protein